MTAGQIRSYLYEQIEALIHAPGLDEKITQDKELGNRLVRKARELAGKAYQKDSDSEEARYDLQRSLYSINEIHFALPHQACAEYQFNPLLIETRKLLEHAWLNSLKERFWMNSKKQLEAIPDPAVFLIDEIASKHSAGDELFDFLRDEADLNQFREFFRLDAGLNIRFYDCIVMSLLAAPQYARYEIGENFYDEMGRGQIDGAHTTLFKKVAAALDIDVDESDLMKGHSWEGLSGYNLFVSHGIQRSNYYRAFGNMLVTEYFDPEQYKKLLQGLERIGVLNDKDFVYYSEHVVTDVAHAEGWLERVITPCLEAQPSAWKEILEGVQQRILSCTDYYDFMTKHLKSFKSKVVAA